MPLRVIPRRDRSLNRVVKAATAQSLRRGEVLFEAGDSADAVVLVKEGHLCLLAAGEGRENGRVVAVVGPWEIAGEDALVPNSRRRYAALAGQAAVVQHLDAGRFIRVLTSSRVTREAFLGAVEGDLALARHLTQATGGPRVAARVATVLLDLFTRMGREGEWGWSLPIRITHQTLADLAGAHRSTVTTLLNEWIYQGLVEERARVMILPLRSDLASLDGILERSPPH